MVFLDSRFRIVEIKHTMQPVLADLSDQFWTEILVPDIKLVTFNGRNFDIPLMELAAFRAGHSIPAHFSNKYGARYRYGDAHLDLMDFFTNHGACRMYGGLNYLAKVSGFPGKGDIDGSDVHELYKTKQYGLIAEYCLHDALDTYFVFLRTRIMVGAITPPSYDEAVADALTYLAKHSAQTKRYLARIK